MGVKFHFLNVGNGDSTIVDFPERTVSNTGQKKDARVMMVDIHHYDDHEDYEHIISYFKQNFRDQYGYLRPIFRFVSTHPHKDHLKGLQHLFEESGISIINFWDLEHSFEPQKDGQLWEAYKEDWEKYCELRAKRDEQALYVRRYWDHLDGIKYWDEDRIRILSPSIELYNHAHYKEDGSPRNPEDVDLNNMPYVLLIKINDIKVLLASDAEAKCWEYILKQHQDKIKDIDILKAAHHGRLTGFHEAAVKVMNPKRIVFSISNEMDEEDGAGKEYFDVVPDAKIYKTCDLGNIVFDCDFEGNITLL